MPKNKKLHVKVGDIVIIISGFHKNETGEIIKINKKTGKVMNFTETWDEDTQTFIQNLRKYILNSKWSETESKDNSQDEKDEKENSDNKIEE